MSKKIRILIIPGRNFLAPSLKRDYEIFKKYYQVDLWKEFKIFNFFSYFKFLKKFTSVYYLCKIFKSTKSLFSFYWKDI